MDDDDLEVTELEAKFNRASRHVASLAASLETATLLELYARYKQSTEGECSTPRPSGWFDVKGKQKWDAWKALGDKTKEAAMEEYVQIVEKLDPKFTSTSVDDAASARGAGGSFGVSVSTLSNNEARIEDSAKTIFDWAREGHVNEVIKCLESFGDNKELPRDDEGLTPLHWASDRGHLRLVEALLNKLPDQVNVVDASKQTPLHYACSCGHSEVVSLLVRKGADSSLKDEDGVDCADDVQRILKHLSDRNEDTS